MKLNVIFVLVILLTDISCNNQRNPSLSMTQIQLLEDTLSVEKEKEPEIDLNMPEGYVPKAGVKYRQKYDLTTPPVHIDIQKSIHDVRNITLSQLADNIEYVNVGKHRFGVSAQVTPSGILASNDDGVWLYSSEGKLIREIYKNICEFTISGGWVSYGPGDKYVGITQVRYNEKEDRLWLQYVNGLNEQHLGYMDMSGKLETSTPELKNDMVTLLAPVKPGRVAYGENFVIHQSWRDKAPATYSMYGDTLCRFSVGYDSITSKALRGIGVDDANSYYYHGTHTFRISYSDTLFRVTAPNILKPVYVLDVGTSGRATNQGKTTDVKLEEMYIIQSVREDDKYLYVKFSKDYDCEANRINRKVHFWWGIYDKTKREFFTLPFDSDSNISFENDIDGGMPFWPTTVGARGEKISYTSGKSMKKQLTPAWFEKSKTKDNAKKEKLRNFVRTLKDDDTVVIIVR